LRLQYSYIQFKQTKILLFRRKNGYKEFILMVKKWYC
jgi:hypothetical protein